MRNDLIHQLAIDTIEVGASFESEELAHLTHVVLVAKLFKCIFQQYQEIGYKVKPFEGRLADLVHLFNNIDTKALHNSLAKSPRSIVALFDFGCLFRQPSHFVLWGKAIHKHNPLYIEFNIPSSLPSWNPRR